MTEVRAALEEACAVGRLVGPRVGPFRSSGGDVLEAKASFESEPSVLFDGHVLLGGTGGFEALGEDASLPDYIRDQHRHHKTIPATGSGVRLLEAAGVPTGAGDPGLLTYTSGAADAGPFVSALSKHRPFGRAV